MTPNWDDLHTPAEWADNLDEMAETVAHRYGEYAMSAELKLAAKCIRDQATLIAAAEQLAGRVEGIVSETERKAKAALESLSRLP